MLREVPTHPSQARLGHAPRFLIEKCFVLPPDMLADFHIFLSKHDLVVAPLTKDTSRALSISKNDSIIYGLVDHIMVHKSCTGPVQPYINFLSRYKTIYY